MTKFGAPRSKDTADKPPANKSMNLTKLRAPWWNTGRIQKAALQVMRDR
jgi:hypothetical protein